MEELKEKIIEEINVASYFLAKKNYPYDILCWKLAEKRLMYKNPETDFSEELVKQNAAAIYFSCCEYDVMCWLIAELDILLKYEIYGREI
ncbi:MAG: hypothetical protein ACFFHD_09790 [Promethearchaeota archaeon]